MTILPDFLVVIVNHHMGIILSWVSERIYENLLKEFKGHFLVKLKAKLDLSVIEAKCEGYHHSHGVGQKPVHSVKKLVRILILKYLFDWSLREMEEQLKANLLVRWFVGYGIMEAVADHSTIERFEQWAKDKTRRVWFDEILNQIDADFPEGRNSEQIGDTFGMQANAACRGLVGLLRQVSTKMLAVMKQEDEGWYKEVLKGYETSQLYGEKKEMREIFLSKEEREQRLAVTVIAVLELKTRIEATLKDIKAEKRKQVEFWLEKLDKIVSDEVKISLIETKTEEKTKIEPVLSEKSINPEEVNVPVHCNLPEPDEQIETEIQDKETVTTTMVPEPSGQVKEQDKQGIPTLPDAVKAALCVHERKEKGSFRIASAIDWEATFRKHQTVYFGFNISVAITARDSIIREIFAETGATPDRDGVVKLIANQMTYHKLAPHKMIYDQAAGTGKTRAEVAKESHGQTQLVARIPPNNCGKRYGPDDFQLSEDGETMTCPNGQISSASYASSEPAGVHFHFQGSQCQGCPLRDKCRDPKANPNGIRKVFISQYRDHVVQAKLYNQTADFGKDMRQRAVVERAVSVLTRYDGARRARRRGTAWADFQAKMCAMARNLRTWIKLLDAKPALA